MNEITEEKIKQWSETLNSIIEVNVNILNFVIAKCKLSLGSIEHEPELIITKVDYEFSKTIIKDKQEQYQAIIDILQNNDKCFLMGDGLNKSKKIRNAKRRFAVLYKEIYEACGKNKQKTYDMIFNLPYVNKI